MSLRYVVIECNDPKAMGQFWQSALALSSDGRGDYHLESQGEKGVKFLFSTIANQAQPRGIPFLRLSPDAGNVPSEVARLCGLGATIVGKIHRGWGMGEVTMSDPEGNEFIVESGLHEIQGFEDLPIEAWDSGDEFWADAAQLRPDVAGGISYSGTPSD